MDTNNFNPTSLPGVTPMSAPHSFDPTSLPGVAPLAQKPNSSLGSFALNAGKGALNFIDNNPVSKSLTSLAALPMQGVAKVLGQPDPYAHGIGGGQAPVSITSSDQPLSKFAEEEAGNALTAGSLLVPAGGVADAITGGAGVLGTLGRVGAQGVLGGVQGLGGGMQAGQDASQLKWSTATGAALGSVLSGVGESISGLTNKFAKGAGDEQLTIMKDKLKTLKNNFAENSTKTTDPITTLEQNGLIKDLKVIEGKVNVEDLTNPRNTGSLDNMIQDQKDAGAAAAENMPGGMTVKAFKDAVIENIKKNTALKQAGNVAKTLGEIEKKFSDYEESYGDTIPFKEMNGVRMQMNKMFDAATWDAERAIGNTSRDILYNLPNIGAALKSAMANEGELLKAKDFILKLDAHAVKGGLLGKYIADAVGAGVGASMGAPVPFVGPAIGGVAGAYATNKAANMLQGRYFSPILAKPAQGLRSIMPTLGAARQVGQATLIPSVVGKSAK